MADPYIVMEHISKRFGSVLANNDVGLSVRRGEIVALLGENGSGKSTLVNILAGIYLPDTGSIQIDGSPRFFHSPHDAIVAGVGMVHQHFMLIPVMNARENISLGEKGYVFNKKAVSAKISRVEQEFGLTIPHDKKIYDMSVGEKQTVEILKVLYRGASILILDEPTAVLTPQETMRLFAIMRNMRDAGCAIIIITHKLGEVMEISDRVAVLRGGQLTGSVNTRDTTPRELTEMMVGASVSLEINRPAPAASVKQPMLEVRSLSLSNKEGVKVIDDISFDLYGGEILGVAGIAGSGQKELCEILTGLRHADSGSARFEGDELLKLSPRAIKNRGIRLSFIPEDRLGMGLVAGMSITDNVLLRHYDGTPGIFINRASGKTQAETIVQRYAVSTPSVNHIVKKLSGGNIQKVLLGREIETNPRLLITAYPARGLDIGASYSIYDMLNERKKRGVAVLFIGEDLDVLRELCDRIIVIHNGTLMSIVDPFLTSKEDIGLLMLGHR
ncbi:MAG: ABC transporter ATP-binding protein [Treponema sp.]|jgi:simple sugar transport system ATP-binding protein|nr:ABC transporter ATP-binding protein [Treponema sp.]